MRTLLITLLCFLPLFAHKLNIFTYKESETIFINSYFASGAPCKKCKVEIKDSSERVIEQGETDEQGEFKFSYTASARSVVIDAGHGHQESSDLDISSNQEEIEVQKQKSENKEILNAIIGVVLILLIFTLLGFIKRGKR